MSITRALEDKKKFTMTKLKPRLHFYTLSLSLTLNNAFTFLGSDDYLGTLNPKLLGTRCKFSKRICPILQNKKIKRTSSHNRFLFIWELEVGSPSGFHNQPCQPVLTVRTGLRTGLRTRSGFENSPTLV
jgi:hypothetical protein